MEIEYDSSTIERNNNQLQNKIVSTSKYGQNTSLIGKPILSTSNEAVSVTFRIDKLHSAGNIDLGIVEIPFNTSKSIRDKGYSISTSGRIWTNGSETKRQNIYMHKNDPYGKNDIRGKLTFP